MTLDCYYGKIPCPAEESMNKTMDVILLEKDSRTGQMTKFFIPNADILFELYIYTAAVQGSDNQGIVRYTIG